MGMSIVGVGTDVVDVARAQAMLDRFGTRATRRLLTASEAGYVQSCAVPARHFAARLAAKEAAFKALQSLPGARGIGWLDLEVVRGPNGAPALALHGTAAAAARHADGLTLHLSMSHSDTTAVAVVVAEHAPGGR